MAIRKRKQYRRLPGGRLHRHALWQGSDHLLHVRRRAFSEEYTRFFFRDIQAVLFHQTGTWKILAAIFGVLAGLTGWFALLSDTLGFQIFWWALFGIFGGLTLGNWLLGPTCRCYLVTAVSRYHLPGLKRTRTVKNVMQRLRRLIQDAQRDIQIDTTEPAESSPPTASSGNPFYLRTSPAINPVETSQKPVKQYKGTVHLLLFWLLLLSATATGISLFLYNVGLIILYWISVLSVSLCVIIALIKQHGANMTSALKGITWGTFGYVAVSYITGYAFFMMVTIKSALDAGPGYAPQNEFEMYRAVLNLSPQDSPVFFGIYLILAGSALLLGGLGLWQFMNFKNDSYSLHSPLS
jgi:hypothetical protein